MPILILQTLDALNFRSVNEPHSVKLLTSHLALFQQTINVVDVISKLVGGLLCG